MFRCFPCSSRGARRCWIGTILVVFVTVFIVYHILLHKRNMRKPITFKMNTITFKRKGKIIDILNWVETPTTGCGNNFKGYGEEFVRLRNARLNPKLKVFSIPCYEENIPSYTFKFGHEGTPLQAWHNNMKMYPPPSINSLKPKETTTIVVMRIEAHNLYHTMCEWYNVFLLSILLDLNPSQLDILFFDDRHSSILDETWDTLFNNLIRYKSVDYDSAFKDLIWNWIGYESPMNFHFSNTLPYINDFKSFFLNAFNVPETKTLDCDKLTVTLFLRRDYMTHPEKLNLTGGLVHRKFKNENEIIQEIKDIFNDSVLNVVMLEQMSMKEQLNIVANTDVLFGMHGAGMTHVLFLPKHAVVFEMFPRYWPRLPHFQAFARWRHIKYFGWQNWAPENEFPDFYTKIPIETLRLHCHMMKKYICGDNRPVKS